jgi:hypothetical protein
LGTREIRAESEVRADAGQLAVDSVVVVVMAAVGAHIAEHTACVVGFQLVPVVILDIVVWKGGSP